MAISKGTANGPVDSIEAGISGIFASCEKGKEARSVTDLYQLFEKVCVLFPNWTYQLAKLLVLSSPSSSMANQSLGKILTPRRKKARSLKIKKRMMMMTRRISRRRFKEISQP